MMEGARGVEELAHILTFVRVVKAGSFAGAARQLKVTDSVASKHVAKLEQALGVRLLHRNTRKLSLTEAGAAYHAHCARIVAELESGRRTLEELQATPRGTLRVTAPVPVASTLGPLLQAFLARHPQITLELDASNRIVDLAGENFDVALRASSTGPTTPDVVARLLSSTPLQPYAAPAYLQRAGRPRHPADLAQHNCLVVPAAMPDGIWRFRRGDERVEVAVRGSLQTDTVEALRDLVIGGGGITLLTAAFAQRARAAGQLVALLDDWEVEPRFNLYAVYLPAARLAPKVRVFVDFLVERFAGAAAA